MQDDLDEPGTALALAESIVAILERQLERFDADQITLSREEAVVTLGLVKSVVCALRKPAR